MNNKTYKDAERLSKEIKVKDKDKASYCNYFTVGGVPGHITKDL